MRHAPRVEWVYVAERNFSPAFIGEQKRYGWDFTGLKISIGFGFLRVAFRDLWQEPII